MIFVAHLDIVGALNINKFLQNFCKISVKFSEISRK